VWSADAAAGQRVVDIVSMAAPTLLGWTVPLTGSVPPRELWTRAFALTFGAELRAERQDRSAAIVEAEPERYDRFGAAVLRVSEGASPARSGEQARRWWARMQRHGKLYSVARLAKASTTFAGGADYIAWKINRHAGTDIALTPWQRRHPLLAAITLLPRLLKAGAVR
jgi:hypothetical protein